MRILKYVLVYIILCFLSYYQLMHASIYFFIILTIFFFFSVLPTVRVWQSEVNATADVGQPAVLTCAVDGYPEPMVTWTRLLTQNAFFFCDCEHSCQF